MQLNCTLDLTPRLNQGERLLLTKEFNKYSLCEVKGLQYYQGLGFIVIAGNSHSPSRNFWQPLSTSIRSKKSGRFVFLIRNSFIVHCDFFEMHMDRVCELREGLNEKKKFSFGPKNSGRGSPPPHHSGNARKKTFFFQWISSLI